jgi:hypothetical protein
VPRILVPPPPAERRVRHGKFGDGVVLRLIEPDKVEVDFGAHGIRKLMAASVEFVS